MTEEKQQNQDRPLAFTAAQGFFCAWLIRLRAAADIRRTPPAQSTLGSSCGWSAVSDMAVCNVLRNDAARSIRTRVPFNTQL
jgi:hypothetical protein